DFPAVNLGNRDYATAGQQDSGQPQEAAPLPGYGYGQQQGQRDAAPGTGAGGQPAYPGQPRPVQPQPAQRPTLQQAPAPQAPAPEQQASVTQGQQQYGQRLPPQSPAGQYGAPSAPQQWPDSGYPAQEPGYAARDSVSPGYP